MLLLKNLPRAAVCSSVNLAIFVLVFSSEGQATAEEVTANSIKKAKSNLHPRKTDQRNVNQTFTIKGLSFNW